MAQRAEEKKIKEAITGLFSVVMKRSLSEIQDLHVHKDKDPVVEIQFEGKLEKFHFQCDYGRQQFIEALIDIKTGKSRNESIND